MPYSSSLTTTPCHSATPCRSERWYPVVLSEAKNLLRNPSETAAFNMGPVRRDAARSTSLRIKQPFSPRISASLHSTFAYAGGDSVCSGVASSGCISLCKCRDMRGRPLVYAFSGIIRAHISFGFPNGFPMCDGPRTRYFRIFLNDKALQKDDVRGPIIFRGITNKANL